MFEGLCVYFVVSNLLMMRLAEVILSFLLIILSVHLDCESLLYGLASAARKVSLAVLIMAVLCQQQRKCSFALLSQTLHFMMIPSYMGAGLLFAHPTMMVSLMLCLCGLFLLTRDCVASMTSTQLYIDSF